jgi:hypothetical protein
MAAVVTTAVTLPGRPAVLKTNSSDTKSVATTSSSGDAPVIPTKALYDVGICITLSGDPRRDDEIIHLTCGVCHHLADVPLETTCCGRVFCQECVYWQTITTCTQCHKEVEVKSLVKSMSALRAIESRRVRCIYYNGAATSLGSPRASSAPPPAAAAGSLDMGICIWTGKRSDLQNHLNNDCGSVLIKCSSCTLILHRYKLTEHNATDCRLRRVTCSWCGTSRPAMEENSHMALCGKVQISCPNGGCAAKDVTRETLTIHRNECEYEVIPCPDHIIGCTVLMERRSMDTHTNNRDVQRQHRRLHDRYMAKQVADLQAICQRQSSIIEQQRSKLQSLSQHIYALDTYVKHNDHLVDELDRELETICTRIRSDASYSTTAVTSVPWNVVLLRANRHEWTLDMSSRYWDGKEPTMDTFTQLTNSDPFGSGAATQEGVNSYIMATFPHEVTIKRIILSDAITMTKGWSGYINSIQMDLQWLDKNGSWRTVWSTKGNFKPAAVVYVRVPSVTTRSWRLYNTDGYVCTGLFAFA